MPGFSEAPILQNGSVDARIHESWMNLLHCTLGWTEPVANERACREVSRTIATNLVKTLRTKGWPLAEQRILDIGSGHGGLAIELALAGAHVTALEPCEAWRELAIERAAAVGISVSHSGGDACQLPFDDGSFDACVSLQVLEHVQDPAQAISELARVLRPGGRFYVSCENYLAFREQHYAVAWIPCLPKRLASLYLRCRKRDPQFLMEHVHYTYWPLLVKWFIDVGLVDDAWGSVCRDERVSKVESSWKERALYAIFARFCGASWAKTAVACAKHRGRVFRVGFCAEGVRCHRNMTHKRSARKTPHGSQCEGKADRP